MPRTKRTSKSKLHDGQTRGAAVIKEACSNFFGTGRVAGRQEVLEVYTALMRGEFHHWPKLENLQPHGRINAILDAAEKLGKHHGIFQKPSENERDREWKVMHYLAAAYSIRDDRLKAGKSINPTDIWADMVAWAEGTESAPARAELLKEILPLEQEILTSLKNDSERRGYVN